MRFEGNILVLTQWSFNDALIQTYTLPYIDIIRKIIPLSHKIVLITSEQENLALKRDEIELINAEWKQKNIELVTFSYHRFGIKKLLSFICQFWRIRQLIYIHKIKVIHAVGTPAGGIGYLLKKLARVKLIVDSYEPHAEAMVENGTWKRNGLAYKILHQLEKRETSHADYLIGTTEGMKQYAKEQFGIKPVNFFSKPACVNLEKFSPREKNIALLLSLGLENKIVCVYAGKLGGIYLKQEIFQFIRSCYDHWGERFRFILLTNASKEEVFQQREIAGLPEHVILQRYILHEEMPDYLSLADFALNPVKPVPTKRYCTSIKDGEYWAMGLPVIISPNISDDSDIIEKEKIGVVVNFAERAELSGAIIKIEELLWKSTELKKIIRKVAEHHRSFEIARKVYQKIYDRSF
jgi:glycosyltransferase involved in cell wall biosynthesis